MKLAEKVSKLAEERGWSGNYAMRKAGLWETYLSRWKKGKNTPTLEQIIQLCETFGCDANWLIDDRQGWEDQPGKNWHAHLYAQAISLIGQLGPEEIIRRVRAAGPIAASADVLPADPESVIKPAGKGGASDQPKRRPKIS